MLEITNGVQLSTNDWGKLGILEQNAILYYADFLSLECCHQPVTDNCKYYFIQGTPINSAYIVGLEPEYDPENKYVIQAYNEYQLIKDKFGDEGIKSFIGDICMIRARGCVGPIQMLGQIHLHSTKPERAFAFQQYYKSLKKRRYIHTTLNENGEPRRHRCTKYVYHAERMLAKRNLPKNIGNYQTESSENIA